jgi:hypothetical protein
MAPSITKRGTYRFVGFVFFASRVTRVLARKFQDELLKEQPPRIQAADAIRGVGIAGKVGRWVSDWAWGMVGYARNPLDDENEYVVVAELKVGGRHACVVQPHVLMICISRLCVYSAVAMAIPPVDRHHFQHRAQRLAEALLSRRQALAAQDEMQRVVLRSTLLKVRGDPHARALATHYARIPRRLEPLFNYLSRG